MRFFEKTFAAMDGLFKTMDEEMKSAFSGADGDLQITAQNGDVIISGKVRTLIINGHAMGVPEDILNGTRKPANHVPRPDEKGR